MLLSSEAYLLFGALFGGMMMLEVTGR